MVLCALVATSRSYLHPGALEQHPCWGLRLRVLVSWCALVGLAPLLPPGLVSLTVPLPALALLVASAAAC